MDKEQLQQGKQTEEVQTQQDNQQTEEVEVKDQPEKVDEQKPVEQSQFNKYRDAYLRERLREMNVKEGPEIDAAIKFINKRADETDSNLEQVFDDLKVRMRLEQRVKYVDPSPMNFARQYPAPVDLRDVGRQMYKELKRKGRL
jgi:hypothetical protein